MTPHSTDQHEVYADLVTPSQTQADCRATGDRLGLAAPSLRFDDHPTDTAKPRVEISAATARLAAAIYGD